MTKTPISVLIPTKDEERNLPSTLECLDWVDQIVVFDSFSSDNTVSIAGRRGCDVYQRQFDNFADHKNWALRNIPFRNDWILILDADEKVSRELRDEIAALCGRTGDCNGYYIARQIWVDGIWLKYAGMYPDYQLRFFKKGSAWYEPRIVHEHMIVYGRIGYLTNPLVHIDGKGVQRYIERHSRYAEMEAVEAFIVGRTAACRAVFPDGPVARRRRLKTLAYRHLPFRPLMVFLYSYVIKLGFLMGRTGLKVCALRMFYEYMIDLYLRELEDRTSPIFVKYGAYIEERVGSSLAEGDSLSS
jgi:glycosyltransferase involved in cell wall biosynthesis